MQSFMHNILPYILLKKSIKVNQAQHGPGMAGNKKEVGTDLIFCSFFRRSHSRNCNRNHNRSHSRSRNRNRNRNR